MGKINLNVTGGDGPFTITIRESTELSGNRYTGPNPTNTLTNLDVNYIKDNVAHLYTALVSNGNCTDGTQTFEQTCPCEILPSFVASQNCSNPLDPKITVTASIDLSSFLRIKIINSSNVVVHNVVTASGTQNFPVANNASYTVVVEREGLNSCAATPQVINVACSIECALNVTISNPIC